MPEPLIAALVQAPFVLVMAYLVQRFLAHLAARDEQWRGYLTRIEERRDERLAELAEAVRGLSAVIVQHDAATRPGAPHAAPPPMPLKNTRRGH